MTFPSYSVSSRLIWALVVSLVIHAILLLQDDFQTTSLSLVRPIRATLKRIAVSDSAEQRPLALPPPKIAPTAERQARKTMMPPVASPDKMPINPPAAAVADAAAPKPLSNSVSDTQSAATANPMPSDGLDPDGLRGYRVALAGELRRYKDYPPRAVEAGWSGTAEVAIAIGASGAVQSIQISKTSGYRVLDEKAVDMMRQAAPRTAIPDTLRGHPFLIKVPIAFNFDDQ